jgi:hypothetical protein
MMNEKPEVYDRGVKLFIGGVSWSTTDEGLLYVRE